MRVLPENLRNLLKKPIGLLVDEKQLITILAKEKKVVSIGDMVTSTILKNDIKPVFCVVDYKTRRGKCPQDVKVLIKSFSEKTVVVNNPPGCISNDLWAAIEEAYKNINKFRYLIEVNGEEDLASLVAIYLAPRDVTVIYGLPDKGVLVVKSDDKYKKMVKEILDKM